VSRDRIVRAGKRSLAAALAATGVLALVRRVALRHGVVVLTYHRVLPEAELARTWSHPGIIVTAATFAAQMASLERWFHVLTLAEFLEVLDGADVDRPSCLITFDDGWLDTYTHAWPVLRRRGLPATVFLPVDHIESGRPFWQEELSELLSRVASRARQDPAFVARAEPMLRVYGLEGALRLQELAQRDEVRQLARVRKEDPAWPALAAVDALHELADGLPHVEAPVDRFVSWAQVEEMRAGGLTFGGHGASHRVLTTLTPAEADADIARCRAVLQERCPDALSAFCYPNGNHDAGIAASVERQGFRAAFDTEPGFVKRGAPRFSLPRINVHEDMTDRTPMFGARMLGLV
jgi:peptidoglycan/xylan/chitin deacetylase (PgdA/CDA1 family)